MFRGDQAILLLIILYAPGVLIYLMCQYFKIQPPHPYFPVQQEVMQPLIEAKTSKPDTLNSNSETPDTIFQIGNNGTSVNPKRAPCQMDSCFNYDVCPMFSNPAFKLVTLSSMPSNDLLHKALLRSKSLVTATTYPCFTLLIWKKCQTDFAELSRENGLVQKYGNSNLVIWLDCPDPQVVNSTSVATLFPKAMIVTPYVTNGFQYGYDIVAGYLGTRSASVFATAKLKREVLVNFDESCKLERKTIAEIRQEMAKNNKNAKYFFPCPKKNSKNCGRPNKETLENSVFTVICLPKDPTVFSTPSVQRKLYDSVFYGSIPVIVGLRFLPPFQELIEWSKILIQVPTQRMTQLPKLLSSYSEAVMETMRINGRLAFNEYMGSLDKLVNALLTTINSRLGFPGIYYVSGNAEETRAQFEAQKPNVTNTTHLIISKYQEDYSSWYLPQAKLGPSSSLWGHSFTNIATEVRSNISLPDSLHGEKFTIVIPTYDRIPRLMKLLRHLKGMPRLDKIIIAWNSRTPPNRNLSWPVNMTVPIHVMHMPKNSLNNRFLPFDAIETDAVLSLDDDIYVSHANLLFGFRVWQQNRHRIVGYPGRGVYSKREGRDWFYDYDLKQCSVSFVLTGCAFLHKMYHVLYSFHMPQFIRNKVDMKMNCEDIAMNFLVSHLTQQPPIKVTSQHQFSCYGCGPANNSLSSNGAHLGERTSCIAEFGKVYGYYPLFNTQYLATDLFLKKDHCLASRSGIKIPVKENPKPKNSTTKPVTVTTVKPISTKADVSKSTKSKATTPKSTVSKTPNSKSSTKRPTNSKDKVKTVKLKANTTKAIQLKTTLPKTATVESLTPEFVTDEREAQETVSQVGTTQNNATHEGIFSGNEVATVAPRNTTRDAATLRNSTNEMINSGNTAVSIVSRETITQLAVIQSSTTLGDLTSGSTVRATTAKPPVSKKISQKSGRVKSLNLRKSKSHKPKPGLYF